MLAGVIPETALFKVSRMVFVSIPWRAAFSLSTTISNRLLFFSVMILTSVTNGSSSMMFLINSAPWSSSS